MTMKELAKLAGVSPAAVSRYLNGGSLSREKRAVIRAAIEKTGTRVMMGDLDSDGAVTTADARLALRYAVKLQSFTGLLDASCSVQDMYSGDYAITNETVGIPAEAAKTP